MKGAYYVSATAQLQMFSQLTFTMTLAINVIIPDVQIY